MKNNQLLSLKINKLINMAFNTYLGLELKGAGIRLTFLKHFYKQ